MVQYEMEGLAQGPFVREMSKTISSFMNRFGNNPLRNRAEQFGLGFTGGADMYGGFRSIDTLLDFPVVSARK